MHDDPRRSREFYIGITAEDARQIRQAAQSDEQAEQAEEAQERAKQVRITATQHLADIYALIEAEARSAASTEYSYGIRIAAGFNSPEEVDELVGFCDEVNYLILAELTQEQRGFNVQLTTEVVQDYRAALDAPPEYYDSRFRISW